MFSRRGVSRHLHLILTLFQVLLSTICRSNTNRPFTFLEGPLSCLLSCENNNNNLFFVSSPEAFTPIHLDTFLVNIPSSCNPLILLYQYNQVAGFQMCQLSYSPVFPAKQSPYLYYTVQQLLLTFFPLHFGWFSLPFSCPSSTIISATQLVVKRPGVTTIT